ncbi:glutathione S-transferase family protein [Kordiimonas aquimaris]|uniref:glutathione S-transferase family protein n=1 Tax=Kordiimonas aquimaris TaxID=707591 RepID=UPI0021D1E72C|nr:glutathione S-transferase [Kordiimonas aquimaris]
MNTQPTNSNKPIILYRNPLSGHCHRVELMLSLLGLSYETVDLDMANGAHKAPDYLIKNAFGQVPAINDNGTLLSDSNAILVYLVQKYGADTNWLPKTPHAVAEVQRWLSVAAGEIVAGPCSARLVTVFGATLDHELAKQKAVSLFGIMEPMLGTRKFLTGDEITIADVSAYTYIAHAPEGGVSLEPYPNIRKWLSRIEAQPHFVGMKKTTVANAA